MIQTVNLSESDKTEKSYLSPAVPCQFTFLEEVKPGWNIRIQATPDKVREKQGKRFFCVEIMAGNLSSDVALLIEPKFDNKNVSLKSYRNRKWNEEMLVDHDFVVEPEFEIRIEICFTGFRIYKDDKVLEYFRYQIPLCEITKLHVDGTVKIDTLDFEFKESTRNVRRKDSVSENLGSRLRKPSVGGLETLYNVVVDKLDDTTNALMNKSAELIKSLQINVDTRLSVLPFPWKSEIGCLWPGKHLFVIGAPNLDAARFSVNFMIKEDIALHFNPRFFDDENERFFDDEHAKTTQKTTQNYVVCNSRVGGQWGEEERTESRFPFARGHRFHITFVCEPEQFKILVDGMEFMSFIHRETIHGVKSYRSIDSLHIDGDIALKECIS